MISNSNSTKRSTDSKTKKDNKDDVFGSTKNTKKASSVESTTASNSTANITVSTASKTSDSKTKKDNKDDVFGSTKNKGNSILPLKLDDLKNDNDKEQLSYYEKQVLKELKGIRKASKNILKTMKKFNS